MVKEGLGTSRPISLTPLAALVILQTTKHLSSPRLRWPSNLCVLLVRPSVNASDSWGTQTESHDQGCRFPITVSVLVPIDVKNLYCSVMGGLAGWLCVFSVYRPVFVCMHVCITVCVCLCAGLYSPTILVKYAPKYFNVRPDNFYLGAPVPPSNNWSND
jgi:hypothetical protein